MLIGYARVSTQEQNLSRQIEALINEGVDEQNIYCDKISGAKESRPALDKMLSYLREGDTVCVVSFDRLARSTKQLLSLVEFFNEYGINLVSLKENIRTDTPQGKLFFTISAAFAEFERAITRERQAEGIAIAKQQGRMKGRPKVDEDKLNAAVALWQANETSISKIQELTGISKSRLYQELAKRNLSR